MPGRKAAPSASTPPQSRSSPSKSKSKGKQPAAASPARSPAATPSKRQKTQQDTPAAPVDDRDALVQLAERIADNAHLLLRGTGSDDLAQLARDVAKRAFDRALSSEPTSFPHLATLLASLSPSAGPSTRSSTTRDAAASTSSSFALDLTPLSELTVDGMDPDMVWEQMELRGRTVDGLMDEMFGQTEEDQDEDAGEGEGVEDEEGEFNFDDEDEGDFNEEEDEDEDDGGEEPDEPEEEAYFRRLGEGKEEGLGSDDIAFQDGEDDEDEDEDEEQAEDPMADETKGLTLDNFDGEGSGGRKRAPRRATGPASEVDDAFFSLHDFHQDADEGEFEMDRMLKGEMDDDELDDEDGEGGIDLFAPVDGLGGSDDEDEEEGDLDAGGMMYKDFFDPPRRPVKKLPSKPKPAAKPSTSTATSAAAAKEGKEGKRGVRFSESVKVKEIPHRSAGRRRAGSDDDEEEEEEEEGEENEMELAGEGADDFDALALDGEEDEEEDEEMDGEGEESFGMSLDGAEDDEDEEGSEEDDDAGLDEGQETIDRFKNSLFDDEDEEEQDKKNLSRHERRLMQLSTQIAALEQENVGPKDWATLGEAQSRDRPVNSLLEEDLEFERMGKVAPMVTEETTKSIEDLIKKRILDNHFDDVERRRPVDPNAFLPSRYMELQDSKSSKSLAEVYEDEFRDQRERAEGRKVVHELDKDLQKKHDEIEALFEDLAARLDALSNARFTPKAPKAAITTVSNLPSLSIESALPTTNSTSALLAPEEVYSASGASSALSVDKADLTPAQKKAARQKAREQRKKTHEHAQRVLEKEQKKRGVKGEKEAAEMKLIGTRGVTVLGKNGEAKTAAGGKKRKRGDGEGVGAVPSSVALKL